MKFSGFFSLYGTLNALIVCTLIFLSIISHARAAYFDPGFVALPKKSIDFSDVQINDSTNSLLKVNKTKELNFLITNFIFSKMEKVGLVCNKKKIFF